MPRVTFLPSGRTFDLARGGSLFRAVLRVRLPLARSCRGTGVCALCRVRVVGDASGLLPMSAAEAELARRSALPDGERYACLARVVGDVTVTASYW